jgi:hypothetical protein
MLVDFPLASIFFILMNGNPNDHHSQYDNDFNCNRDIMIMNLNLGDDDNEEY